MAERIDILKCKCGADQFHVRSPAGCGDDDSDGGLECCGCGLLWFIETDEDDGTAYLVSYRPEKWDSADYV